MINRNDNELFKSIINFKTDIYFQNIGKIKTHLIHALTENMDICVEIYRRQNIEKSANSIYFNDAGLFFNTLTITTTISQITDEELLKIAMSMKNSLCDNNFSTLCQDSDPVKIMKQFTKYLFVPVRVSFSTIPENIQTNLLKQFLTTIIVLMFLNQYITKFKETITVLDVYGTCIEQYFQDNKIRTINKMKSVDWKRVDTYLHQPLKKDNISGCYFYGLNKIIGSICIEIINKFCPNFKIVKSINPKYNGVWESPFDTDISDQLRELNKIFS